MRRKSKKYSRKQTKSSSRGERRSSSNQIIAARVNVIQIRAREFCSSETYNRYHPSGMSVSSATYCHCIVSSHSRLILEMTDRRESFSRIFNHLNALWFKLSNEKNSSSLPSSTCFLDADLFCWFSELKIISGGKNCFSAVLLNIYQSLHCELL